VKANLAALAAGLVFGTGLVLSEMTNPAKVTAFLDVLGGWDPSLAFVMIGAVGVHSVLLRLVLRRPKPLFAGAFQVPKKTVVDWRLIVGAAVFGVGWGLGGVCPGPGIVDAASGSFYALVFVAAMTLGSIAVSRVGAPERHEPGRDPVEGRSALG
jgi:uncharacterized membrane protein YedE/YeeE